MTDVSGRNRVERDVRLKWVPIGLMRTSSLAQRDLNQARVDKIAAAFDLEQIGTPTVNHRDGHYYVIDGQHRVEALRQIGWGDQQLQCWAYDGLSEQEEAEKFLKLNDVLVVDHFARFKVGVQAGRPLECDIDRIVRSQGLCVSKSKTPGAISAVSTLTKVYNHEGASTLAKTLGLIRDAYGDAGLQSFVIAGIGLMCGRYGSDLDIDTAVVRLGGARGGVNGLLNNARAIRNTTGNYMDHCVAAAAVEILNAGRGGKKLPSWWRENVSALSAVS